MAVSSISKQEFHRLDVLLSVQSGRPHVTDACGLLGLQRRQVFRLLRCLKRDGAASLLSKRRGKPSNHRLPAVVRTLALSIVRERYPDFGRTPAFAPPSRGQALGSGEAGRRGTLRGWMIVDGQWHSRSARSGSSPSQPPPHPTRQTGADRRVEDPAA